VRIRLGDLEVATRNFNLGDTMQVRKFALPAGAVVGKEQIVLTFDIEIGLSPCALNISPDWRQLGVAIRSLTVENAGAAPR
jgi:hypothetical protein